MLIGDGGSPMLRQSGPILSAPESCGNSKTPSESKLYFFRFLVRG